MIQLRIGKHWKLMYLLEDIKMEKLEETIFRHAKMARQKNLISMKCQRIKYVKAQSSTSLTN